MHRLELILKLENQFNFGVQSAHLPEQLLIVRILLVFTAKPRRIKRGLVVHFLAELFKHLLFLLVAFGHVENCQVFHVAQLLQSVIKHDLFELIVGRNAQSGNKALSLVIALSDFLVVIDQLTALIGFRELEHEPIQVFDGDVASGVRVKFLPNVHEVLDFILFNWELKVIGLLQKGVDDDRNEEVDEYLGDQDVE